MMLMSIRPKYAYQILSGAKKYELRRRLTFVPYGTRVIIYASGNVKAIVGEFKAGRKYTMSLNLLWDLVKDRAGVSKAEFDKYFKLKNDPRITPIGKILRKTSLDELPQFINVLKGEMNVVGPRPLTPREIDFFGEFKEKILSVNPGLTGLAQVSGRSNLSHAERALLDVDYIDNRSVWLDLLIILKTFKVIFTGHGAY